MLPTVELAAGSLPLVVIGWQKNLHQATTATPQNAGRMWKKTGYLVGGFNHLEKYESQWEGLSHILWKIKNAPNHQPGLMIFDGIFSGCKREYHGIIKHGWEICYTTRVFTGVKTHRPWWWLGNHFLCLTCNHPEPNDEVISTSHPNNGLKVVHIWAPQPVKIYVYTYMYIHDIATPARMPRRWKAWRYLWKTHENLPSRHRDW